MSEAVVPSFLAAADWFIEIARRDDVEARWSNPSALPGYTIGGLVGHVAAAVAWVEPLLEGRSGDAPVLRLGQYYLPLQARDTEDLDSALHQGVRAQGERGAGRGPVETVAQLQARMGRIWERLASEHGDRLLDLRPTVPATISLEDFLHTRVVELIVHGNDLAVSLGLRLEPPADAAAATIRTLLATAREESGDLEVIRALARGERSTARLTPVL